MSYKKRGEYKIMEISICGNTVYNLNLINAYLNVIIIKTFYCVQVNGIRLFLLNMTKLIMCTYS